MNYFNDEHLSELYAQIMLLNQDVSRKYREIIDSVKDVVARDGDLELVPDGVAQHELETAKYDAARERILAMAVVSAGFGVAMSAPDEGLWREFYISAVRSGKSHNCELWVEGYTGDGEAVGCDVMSLSKPEVLLSFLRHGELAGDGEVAAAE